MRLKPATPLAIVYFISFALLLISTISAPIVPSIRIAYSNGVSFGVFGYCNGLNNCSSVSLAYNTSSRTNSTTNYNLPDGPRHTLSEILVVTPVAAFLNLVCFLMAVACHFRAVSHSPKFLMGLLIMSFPTLLVTLLAFLVDILVFVPDQSWGCWIVLVATVFVMICSVFTCAMRRTLVSRKARKKLIEGDENMNGTNAQSVPQPGPQPFLAKEPSVATESPYARADSPPPLDGGFPSGAARGQFATYESERSRPSTDDRTPLNRANTGREGSIRTASTTAGRSQRSGTAGSRPTPLDTNIGEPGDGRVSPVSPMEFESSSGPQPRSANSQARRGRGGPPPPGYGRGRGGGPMPRGGHPPQRGGPPRGGMPRGGPRGAYRGMPPPRGGGYMPRGAPGQNGNWYGAGMASGAVVGGAAAGNMMMGDRYRGPPQYQDDYPQTDPYSQPYDQRQQASAYPPQEVYDQYGQSYPQQEQQQLPIPNRGYNNGPSPYPTQHNYSDPTSSYQPQPNPQQREAYPPPSQAYQSTSPPIQGYQSTATPVQAYQPTPPPQNQFSSPAAPPVPNQPSFNDEAVAYSGPAGPAGLRRTPTQSPSQPLEDTVRSPASFGFSGRHPTQSNESAQPRNPPYTAGSMPPMAQDPTPIGQAIEMDATRSRFDNGFSDGREPRAPARGPAELASEGVGSSPHRRKGSPHANLIFGTLTGTSSAPQHQDGSSAFPVEIDSAPRDDLTPVPAQSVPRLQSGHRARAPSDTYYEDVDPRFAQDGPADAYAAPSQSISAPTLKVSGNGVYGVGDLPRDPSASSFYSAGQGSQALVSPSAEDPLARTLSPGAASDTSNFTSVSQRGVNPAWQPGPPSAAIHHVGPGGAPRYGSSSRSRVEDQVLGSNPDFALPKSAGGHVRDGSAGGSHHFPAV